ncbi:MAG: ADP-ribosylglycohydrolase family protein [Thermodesulfobacteriota bacterium]
MKDNRTAMVMASFLGDSLALGVHWIYDAERIQSEYGWVDSLLKPRPDSYHPTKEKGEFTHYGDQTLVLLESAAERGGFRLDDFSVRWRALFKGYRGYYDQATKATLRNFELGKGPEESGSSSNDLAGAARIAPLAFRYRDDPDSLVEAARAQTRMTHNNPVVVDSAEFFARTAQRVLKGQTPISAMTRVGEERFGDSHIGEWIQEGIRSKDEESVAAVGRFGQSCHVDEAFPGVVHLITRYEEDLKEGLIQAVMAGGDNAGRAMIVGMVLGAYLGQESLPVEWMEDLKKAEEIRRYLEKLS